MRSSAAPRPGSEQFAHWVKNEMPRLLGRFGVPVAAVGVVDDGVVAWTRAFTRTGTADDDPVFEVASLSKTVTALAILRLVDAGQLRLDAPVEPYMRRWHFPQSSYDTTGVTIQRLLSHTAGVASSDPPNLPLTAARPSIDDVLAGRTPVHPAVLDEAPGKGFTYSNPGYGVLELVVEEVTGSSFADAVRDLVFEPLGMKRSGFQDDPLYAEVVPGHTSREHVSGRLRRVPRSAGGVVSTAGDIARLMTAVMVPEDDGGVLSRARLGELGTRPEAAAGAFGMGPHGGYALGLAVGLLPSGRRFIANQGSHEGYRALFVAVPDERVALVVLTNSNAGLVPELEIALRWFRDVVGELPGLAAKVEKVRRGVRLGTIAALLSAVAAVASTTAQLRQHRRRWTRRPGPRRLLGTAVPLGLVAGGLAASNANVLGDSVGSASPARLISSDYPVLSLATAGSLAAAAVARGFSRRGNA